MMRVARWVDLRPLLIANVSRIRACMERTEGICDKSVAVRRCATLCMQLAGWRAVMERTEGICDKPVAVRWCATLCMQLTGWPVYMEHTNGICDRSVAASRSVARPN